MTLCSALPPEERRRLFLIEDGPAPDEARTLCARCPTLDACARLGQDEPWNVYAGKGPAERPGPRSQRIRRAESRTPGSLPNDKDMAFQRRPLTDRQIETRWGKVRALAPDWGVQRKLNPNRKH